MLTAAVQLQDKTNPASIKRGEAVRMPIGKTDTTDSFRESLRCRRVDDNDRLRGGRFSRSSQAARTRSALANDMNEGSH